MSRMYFIHSSHPKKKERNRKEKGMVLAFRTLRLSFPPFFYLYLTVPKLLMSLHLYMRRQGQVAFSSTVMCPAVIVRYNYWGPTGERLGNKGQAACHKRPHVCYNNLEVRWCAFNLIMKVFTIHLHLHSFNHFNIKQKKNFQSLWQKTLCFCLFSF